jgi:hypothetical protein
MQVEESAEDALGRLRSQYAGKEENGQNSSDPQLD